MDFFMTVMDERVKTRLRDGPPVLSAGVAAAARGETFGILKRLFLAAVPIYGAAGLGDGNSIAPPIASNGSIFKLPAWLFIAATRQALGDGWSRSPTRWNCLGQRPGRLVARPQKRRRKPLIWLWRPPIVRMCIAPRTRHILHVVCGANRQACG